MTSSQNPNPHDNQQSAQAYQNSGTDAILNLMKILKRRLGMIISVIIIGTSLFIFIGYLQVPKYTAKTLIMIYSRQENIVDVKAVLQGLTPDEATVETQINVLKSRGHIERLANSLNMFDDPEFNQGSQKEGKYAAEFSRALKTISSWISRDLLLSIGLADEKPRTATVDDLTMAASTKPMSDRQATISAVTANYQVFQEGRSYIIGIAFTSIDPIKAATVANRAAELYIEHQRQEKLTATVNASAFLGKRLEELRSEVQSAEARVENFRRTHNLILIEDGSRNNSLKQAEIADLTRALNDGKADAAQKKANLEVVRTIQKNGGDLSSVSEVLLSPVIINYRQQEAELSRNEAELRTYFGSKHPRVQNLLLEKEELHGKIQAEINRIIANMERDVHAKLDRVESIKRVLDSTTEENATNRDQLVQLRELEREAQASRQLYEAFLGRYKETREQLGLAQADSQLISAAAAPDAPSTAGIQLFGATGFTASAMLGTLLALLLDRFDNGIRSSKDVEHATCLTVLSFVPKLSHINHVIAHQYLMTKPLSIYTESIRGIFTSLQLLINDKLPKVVLITSSLPSEGKTTTAISLAVFAAQSMKRTLLIDLDLRHPSVFRYLQHKAAPGLVDYVTGEAQLTDVVQHDSYSGIDFLPAGNRSLNPTKILTSPKMKALLAEVRGSYEFIVIDAPPVLNVHDTKITAILADKIIFVIQWGKIKSEIAENAIAQLRETHADLAGVVLTLVNVKKHAKYGYGDIGQSYGDYSNYYVN